QIIRARLGALLPADTVAQLAGELPDDDLETSAALIEQRAQSMKLDPDGIAKVLAAAGPLAEPEQPPRLLVQFPADIEDLQPPPQTVERLIEDGSLVLFYGESNTGKSTAAIDLGMAIARGEPWRGLKVRQGLVLHMAGEGSHGVRARVRAYLIDRAVPAADIPYGILAGLDLMNGADVADLLATIPEVEAQVGARLRMLIIDTLARCATIDENDGRDMRALIAACDRIREQTGAVVALVHHAGKDTSKGARGHSSLRAAVDTELLIEGTENPRRLSVTKQRDLAPLDPIAFNLEPVTIGQDRENATAITAVVVRHEGVELPRKRPSGRQQNLLLSALEDEAKAGAKFWTDHEVRELARKRLGMTKSTARSALLGLIAAGMLRGNAGAVTLCA
ncbi:MAG: AAA family ATPase, partial [Gammaproteobacteria bacterium]|nr:AAA family ATPase [Gammaproteobacteria bacterium]